MSEIRKDATVAGTQSKPLRILANIISFVFHPVFMPVIITYLLYVLAPNSYTGLTDKQAYFFIIRIAIIAVFFPLLTTILCKQLGFIQSIYMRDPKDRIIPLIATMIFYFWVYWVHKNIDSPLMLRVLFLGNFWGIILLFIINIFFKVSMHTSAAGGFLGIMIVLLFTNPINMMVPLFAAIVLCGIIGTARLLLGAHKPGEIWAGYALGIIAQVAAYIYIIW